MMKKGKTDIKSQDIRESSKRAFVELFRLLLESDTQTESESHEDYKNNEKKDEHSRA